MQRRLRERLRRLPLIDASSGGGAWHENQVLVRADPRRMKAMARRFRQRAIVVLPRRQPARLVVLDY